ncbi:hypothetical protein ACS0TY_011362 [Phlomoides rotata]
MAESLRRGEGWEDEDQLVLLELEEPNKPNTLPLYLIGKFLTNKPFNAYGLLETMKKAMKPASGFTEKEMGHNIFFFQFRTREDLQEILQREPWHFEKNPLMLKELEPGAQPSQIRFNTTTFWLRLYDMPPAAQTEKNIRTIIKKCGTFKEIDQTTLEDFLRTI